MNPMTYNQKPINKMTYEELRTEIRVQRWFSRRMYRLGYVVERGLGQREWTLEQKRAEQIRQYEAGELTDAEFKQKTTNYKISKKFIENNYIFLAYTRFHEQNAKEMQAQAEEALKTKARPKDTRYKKVNAPKRARTEEARIARRKELHRYAMMKQRKSDKYRFTLMRWQQHIEKQGLGALWDRDKFIAICNDRGYITDLSITVLVAEALELTHKQVPTLLKQGAFTWGQVLTLGAVLYMTPKEFADTFMSGYFTEVSDGVFEASLESLPDFKEE